MGIHPKVHGNNLMFVNHIFVAVRGYSKAPWNLGGGSAKFPVFHKGGGGMLDISTWNSCFYFPLVFSILFFLRKCFSVKNDSATTSVCCLKKPIVNSTGNSPSLLAKGK